MTSATVHLHPSVTPSVLRDGGALLPRAPNYMVEITRACLAVRQERYVIMAHLLPADDGKVHGDKLGSQPARGGRPALPAAACQTCVHANHRAGRRDRRRAFP